MMQKTQTNSFSELSTKKVLIATGGTGGHIFPAQILAEVLQKEGISVFFIGGGLNTNRYFKKELFHFKQVDAATPFKTNFLVSSWRIFKGIFQSLKHLYFYRPDLVVGFGSFYSFPVLVAAKLLKKDYILFEPNAFPGKVNQLFSKWAKMTAVVFSVAEKKLKGKCVEVPMLISKKDSTSKEEASVYFGLAPNRLTFLVFGGSQGAGSVNELFSKSMSTLLPSLKDQIQIIHLAGNKEAAKQLRQWYSSFEVPCCVKPFEDRMDLAWTVADVAVCRSGACTIGEQIAFEVPAILIPFPKAADNHQLHNALFIEKEVKGGVVFEESQLSIERMAEILTQFTLQAKLNELKKNIGIFKAKREKSTLKDWIVNFLQTSRQEK